MIDVSEIKSRPLWILDGGLGTELERRGHDLKNELWSAKVLSQDAQAIYDIHMDYLRAGADIILTATYQASISGFMRHLNLSRRESEALMIFATEIACKARTDFQENEKRQVLVGGSFGPFGAILADGSEYRGGYEIHQPEVAEYYRDKVEVMVSPRRNYALDFLAFEAMPTADEALLALRTIESHTWIKAWFSFTKAEAAENFLRSAVSVPVTEHPQVIAVGMNCLMPAGLENSIMKLRGLTDKPIAVYPNRGDKFDAVTKTWSRDISYNSEKWGGFARSWAAHGANIIGGCCGAGPDEIRATREALRPDN